MATTNITRADIERIRQLALLGQQDDQFVWMYGPEVVALARRTEELELLLDSLDEWIMAEYDRAKGPPDHWDYCSALASVGNHLRGLRTGMFPIKKGQG